MRSSARFARCILKTAALTAVQIFTATGMLLLLLAEDIPIAKNVRLTAICLLTVVFVSASIVQDSSKKPALPILLPIAAVGRATFSYYIWHQIILAFVRYTIKTEFTAADILIYLLCVILAGELSNRLIEKPLLSISKKHLFKMLAACVCVCAVSCTASLLIYTNAGVVRDVPELDIYRNDVRRSMHAEYNGRASAYDVDFAADDKPKVLVIGDSFGRNFVNILLEAGYEEKLLLSYYAAKHAEKKSLYLTGIIVPLLVLGIFKYYNFFLTSITALLGIEGGTLRILLPVGISFYTFQAISYVVDVRRGKTAPEECTG